MAPESNTPNANTPSANAPIRQNVAVPKPDAGANVVIDSSAGGQLQLGFDPSVATPTRSGNDLSFDVEGGGKVTVKDFFAVGDESLPSLRLPDGTVVASTDFFSGSGLDMTTAAGPGGGAGGAGSGSGDYRDDAGNLIGGIDRFGKLGTDFWGRGSEVPDPWIGDERPGGTFGFDTWTDVPGDGPGKPVNGFWAAVFEDGQANQHLYGKDDAVTPGQLYFNFTPTGTTSVTAIYLSGFDVGTQIRIGNGPWVEVTDTNQVFRFTEDMFNTNVNDSSHDGVYIIPPPDSDRDMDISARVDMRTAGGQTGTANGTFPIIVDAVADRPDFESGEFHVDDLTGHETAGVHSGPIDTKTGWIENTDSLKGDDTVTVTVPFEATTRFYDYHDETEQHYVLIQVPLTDGDIEWNCLYNGKAVEVITIEGVDYFRVHVDNADIIKADLTNADDAKGTITIKVDFQATGTHDELGATGNKDHIDLEIKVGAMAVENPGDREITYDNNTSLVLDDVDPTKLKLDLINGTLEFKVGWASEGNNDAKHLAPGSSYDSKAAALAAGLDPTATGEKADLSNIGAPITVNISGGNGEVITSVTLEFDSNRGELVLGDGANPNISLVNNGDGTWTISSLDGTGLAGIDLGDVYFRPATTGEWSFDDSDVSMRYTVEVKNAAGITATYESNTFAAIDAVADRSLDVDSKLSAVGDSGRDSSDTSYVEVGGGSGKVVEENNDTTRAEQYNAGDRSGWETDKFSLEYKEGEYGFTLKVKTDFPDTDGSEDHFILVEKIDNWKLGDLTGTIFINTGTIEVVPGPDGKEYYKLQVPSTMGTLTDVKVPLEYTGDQEGLFDKEYTFQTGTLAVEGVKGDNHGHGSGKEYDKINNEAWHLDGDAVKYTIDVLNTGLTVKTGWASEGNNDAKHRPGDLDSTGYDSRAAAIAAGLDPASIGENAVTHANMGAPINFVLEGGTAGTNEFITSITFIFDGSRGSLVVDPALGTPVFKGLDGDGNQIWTLTSSDPSGFGPSIVDQVFFQPVTDPTDRNYYNDDDVDMTYKVTVENEAGATHTYTGTSTVVIDSVADLSTKLVTGINADHDHAGTGYTETLGPDGKIGDKDGGDHGHTSGAAAQDSANDRDFHYGANKGTLAGWEVDELKVDYKDVKFAFSVHVETTFPDYDGSENHYVLVQNPGGNWLLPDADALAALGLKLAGTYSPDGGTTTYWKLLVNGDNGAEQAEGQVSIDVPLQHQGMPGSEKVTIKTGSLAEEKAGLGDTSNFEFDMKNNEAVRTDGTEVTYTADVLNRTLTVKTGWASEGGLDAKHLHTREEMDADPTGKLGGKAANGIADYKSGTNYDGATSDGSARIEVSLTGTQQSTGEYISSITFSFPEGAGGGTLSLTPGGTPLTANPDGTYTLTYSGTSTTSVQLYFTPEKGSFDYSDIKLSYDVTVKNGAGSEFTFKGDSVIVVDAVADRASIYANPDADYVGHDVPNPSYDPDKPVGKDNPKFLEQEAAKPGDEVTVHGTVTFPDISGGENHFILIETGTKGDIYGLQSVTIKGGGGSLTISEFLKPDGTPIYEKVTIGGVDYYKIPATDVVSGQDANGHNLADEVKTFELDITVQTVDLKDQDGNSLTHDNTIGFGGRAVVADVPEGASGGYGGSGETPSGNYEFDKGNNTADNVGYVEIKTAVVETTGLVLTAGKAYENADCNAHLGTDQQQSEYNIVYGAGKNSVDGGHDDTPYGKGFVSRATMLDADGQFKDEYIKDVQRDSAPLEFSGLADNEAISALTVRFTTEAHLSGDDLVTRPDLLMYNDTLIRPGDTNVSIGEGADQVFVTCTYDESTGQITVTIIPADGNYELTSNLYFVPGENFSSADVPLEFAALVQDLASGYTKGFGDSGLTQDLINKLGLDPDHDMQSGGNGTADSHTAGTVGIDAVAQQAGLTITADDVHSQYGDEFHQIAPGTTAKVHTEIDLRGDVTDNSEKHLFLVKVPTEDGLAMSKVTFTYSYIDAEGNLASNTVTIDGSQFTLLPVQSGLGASGGTYFSFDLGSLTPPMADGHISADIYIGTPGSAQGSYDIEVGVRSQEINAEITKGGDWEGEVANNQANVFAKIGIPISGATAPGASAPGWFYENSDKDAHWDPVVDKLKDLAPELRPYVPGREDNAIKLDFTFKDSNDAVDKFNVNLQPGHNDDGSERSLGDLYVFKEGRFEAYQDYMKTHPEADPYEVIGNYGEKVTGGVDLDLLIAKGLFGDNPGSNPLGKDYTGTIAFMPAKDSYSGEDPKIGYEIDVHDTKSGEPASSSNTFVIPADAVAQRPTELDLKEGGQSVPKDNDVDLGKGEERPFTVKATFTDLDETTEHYILVEAQAGWTVINPYTGKELAFPKDTITPEEGGKTYFKIPVPEDQITAIDKNHGSIEVEITLKAPTERIFFLNDKTNHYDLEVKAGSTDKDTSDNEITYHNNTAIVKIGTLSGDLVWGGGDGKYWFEQVTPLYEDNQPYKYLGPDSDQFKAGGELDGKNPQSEVGGTFVIDGPAGEYAIITVPLVNGQPVLDIDGAAYQGNGQYRVDLTGSAQTISATLGKEYLDAGGRYDDVDVKIDNVEFFHSNGDPAHSPTGEYPVMVDAVADRGDVKVDPTDHAKLDDEGHLVYDSDGKVIGNVGGNDASVIHSDSVAGTKGAGGADSVAHFTVEATFPDADGSENHYILVEQVPAWDIPGADTVYINGKTYYKIDVTHEVNDLHQTTFDIAITYKGAVADIFGKTDHGVTTYELQVGTMSQEQLKGDSHTDQGGDRIHTGDGEFDYTNNTAINLDGKAVVQYSPVDSTVIVTATPSSTVEGVGSTISLTVGALDTANTQDEILSLKIGYSIPGSDDPTVAGKLYLIDGSGNKTEIPASGATITDKAVLNGLTDGTYKLIFEQVDHNHRDITFTWTGTVQDMVSGAVESKPGSSTVVVDAVADHSDNTRGVSDVSGDFIAVESGQDAVVTVTTGFRDTSTVNADPTAIHGGLEEHWVVLEQADLRYQLTGVTIDGVAVDMKQVTIKYDDLGRPYYAVLMPDQNDHTVQFTVTTPVMKEDGGISLGAGTIVIDPTRDGADREPNYNNNWTKDIEQVEINTAVVEATTIKVSADVPTDYNEHSGPLQLNFSVTDGHNDTIKDVTITVPTNGKLIVGDPNGTHSEYTSGSVTLTAADLAKGVYFQPDDYRSGDFTLDITGGTVIDLASGAEKPITGQGGTTLIDGNVHVLGVADVPTNAGATYSEVAGTHNVTVTLTAQYADIDGSENHFFVVKVPAGLTLNGSYTALTNAEKLAMGLDAGSTWYKVNANSNTAANASATVSLKVSADYDSSNELEYAAAAQEKSGYATGRQYAASGVQTVTIPDIPNTAPVGAEAEVTAVLSAAAAMHGTLDVAAMFTDVEHDIVTPQAVSFGGGSAMALNPSGSVTIDGEHGTLTVTGDGAGHYTYDYALHHGANVNTTDHDSFNFSGKDSYGADATGLGKLTFEFDEHHIVAQTTGGELSAATVPHGVVIHGGDGNDIITGSSHDDVIYGGAGNDEIHGGAGNDIIYAGEGDNLIHGGKGDDVMYSGSGSDTFLWLSEDFGQAGAAANDTIRDFKLAHDIINFKDVFGANDSIDTLLDTASVDSVSRTVTFTSGGTTFEAQFRSATELMLTLKDGEGESVQTIDVHAADGAHFWDGSAGDSLSDDAMRQILEQMIKNNN